MGSIPRSSSSSTRPSSRDTGFPEGFCGVRNTSLPHPDARTGPDACITADDIDIQKALSRHRRSFLAKHKRTISHGMITPAMQCMYGTESALMLALDSSDLGEFRDGRRKDADSGTLTDGSLLVDEEPSSADSSPRTDRPSIEQSSSRSPKRRSLFNRLMHK